MVGNGISAINGITNSKEQILVIKISSWVLPMHREGDHDWAPELWTPIFYGWTLEVSPLPKRNSTQLHGVFFVRGRRIFFHSSLRKGMKNQHFGYLNQAKPQETSFQRPNKHTPAVSYPSHLIAYHHPLPMERLPHKQTSWMVQVQLGDRTCP